MLLEKLLNSKKVREVLLSEMIKKSIFSIKSLKSKGGEFRRIEIELKSGFLFFNSFDPNFDKLVYLVLSEKKFKLDTRNPKSEFLSVYYFNLKKPVYIELATDSPGSDFDETEGDTVYIGLHSINRIKENKDVIKNIKNNIKDINLFKRLRKGISLDTVPEYISDFITTYVPNSGSSEEYLDYVTDVDWKKIQKWYQSNFEKKDLVLYRGFTFDLEEYEEDLEEDVFGTVVTKETKQIAYNHFSDIPFFSMTKSLRMAERFYEYSGAAEHHATPKSYLIKIKIPSKNVIIDLSKLQSPMTQQGEVVVENSGYTAELIKVEDHIFRNDGEDGIFCSYKNLTSLKGAPKKVIGSFSCFNNNLTSLEGAPEYVGGDFDCRRNELISLEGAPEYVGGDFDCTVNELISLEGVPEYVGGKFNCFDNKLISLKGAPKKVIGSFSCLRNELISLEGAPEYVGGDFDCRKNNLISLEGVSNEIDGNFWCEDNPTLSQREKDKFRNKVDSGEIKIKGEIIF